MHPSRKLIVVIDDDDSVRCALGRQLRAAGFATVAFASAEEYLGVAATLDAAGVVSDINLGAVSGLHLALHPLIVELKIPVILITGGTDPVVAMRAQEIAAVFLQKPIPPGKLLEAVIDTVGEPIPDADE